MIGENKEVNACIHVSMLHLPGNRLRSNGLRSCPQDRPPNIVNTWRQFLCTRSVDVSVEGKKSLWIGGMADDSNAQVYLILSKMSKRKLKEKT